VLLALFLFGGVTITNFILVLIIGITAGTYSSIFIASPLLLIWEGKK
jgi:preprotein translocase subunit SecF